MLKALFRTGLVAVAVFALTPAVPAVADTPGCVTRNEFQRVHRGDSVARVHRIFDTRGRRSSRFGGGGHADVYREYNVCPRWSRDSWSSVDINFDNYSFSGRGFRLYSKDVYLF